MEKKTKDIINEAMRMPAEERATIAENLIASLDRECDDQTEALWQDEVQKRIREIESGAVKCVPWESVRSSLKREPGAKN